MKRETAVRPSGTNRRAIVTKAGGRGMTSRPHRPLLENLAALPVQQVVGVGQVIDVALQIDVVG